MFLPLFLLSCQEEKISDEAGETQLMRVEAERPLMGTMFRVCTYTEDLEAGYEVMEKAFDVAEEFGQRATDYVPDSELNKLTRGPVGVPQEVSENLFEVLLLGRDLAVKTEGIYDPTFGPLTHLWRLSKRVRSVPSEEQIAAARERCGIEFLKFDEEAKTITILRERMQLDLGGIGKGFAADLIFDHLVEAGYENSLVVAGGDLRIGDPPPDKEGWEVSLRTFRMSPMSSISLKNCAVSTSGDLYQNFQSDGTQYSHLIDLETGLGLTSRRAASVILPMAKLTDPLATSACLADDPASLFTDFEGASIRVVYENKEIPPVLTGVFAK